MHPLLLLPLLWSTPTTADAASPVPASPHEVPEPLISTILTVSGGASLGAYESGYLYLLSQGLKKSRRFQVPVLTGASAGSANALMMGMNLCRPVNRDPVADLGYRVWTPVGIQDLFDPKLVKPISVFQRKPMVNSMEAIWDAWKAGLRANCGFVLGISVTRLKSIEIPLNRNFSVPRQEEKFAVEIRGRGIGTPPRITNYLAKGTSDTQPILPLLDDTNDLDSARKNFEMLRSLIFASASFPLAFDPQPVPHCMVKRDEPGHTPKCDVLEPNNLFVDGGVFDNNPLRFANELANSVGAPTATWNVREKRLPNTARTIYAYVDADLPGYPTPKSSFDRPDSLPSLVWALGTQWIRAARTRELYNFVTSAPQLADNLLIGDGQFPKASSPMEAFFGFFEKDFRIFDFYLGMYDAFVRLYRSPVLNDILTEGKGVVPELKEAQATWSPFFCMQGWFATGQTHKRPSCAGDDYRNFRILLQLSMERLYNLCRTAGPEALSQVHPSHHHCRAAIAGKEPPRITAAKTEDVYTTWLQEEGEGELAFILRRFEQYGYNFRDLGVSAERAEDGRFAIRRKMLAMVKALSHSQKSLASATVVDAAGRSLVNTIAYEPPQSWFYATIGSVTEGGFGFMPLGGYNQWFGLTTAVKTAGFLALARGDSFSLALAGGPDFKILPLSDPLFQPAIGFRGGFRFATGDSFLGADCNETDTRNCSRPFVDGYLSVGFLGALRAQLTAEYYLGSGQFDEGRFDLHLGLGLLFL
jgi:predicted acylesterase/phospholipase RssA